MYQSVTVGCIPNSNDFKHPQDRRRYIPYFKQNSISYEIADFDKDYEIVYISLNADLNKWAGYKKKQLAKGRQARVIFDLSDLYLVGGTISDKLRPVFHFLSGRTTTLRNSYKSTVMDMIAGTDVLICGSEEQKNFLDEIHSNVVIVRDYFQDDITLCKTNYQLSDAKVLNVLWEGLSHGNIEIFKMLKNILNDLPSFKINLHIISDSEYCRIGSKYLCKPTYTILKEIFKNSDVNFHFYDWNKTTFSSIATACDLALIPIPDDPLMRRKPENKLLLFWFLGLPVVASDTDSYKRVMQSIDQNYICSKIEDWREKLINLASSVENRERYMKSASAYLETHCSAETIFNTYDTIFFG